MNQVYLPLVKGLYFKWKSKMKQKAKCYRNVSHGYASKAKDQKIHGGNQEIMNAAGL